MKNKVGKAGGKRGVIMAERTGKKKKTPMYADRIGGVRPVYACPSCGEHLFIPDICVACGQRIKWDS